MYVGVIFFCPGCSLVVVGAPGVVVGPRQFPYNMTLLSNSLLKDGRVAGGTVSVSTALRSL